jgi:hypothetical protein
MRFFLCGLAAILGIADSLWAQPTTAPSSDPRYFIAEEIFAEDFNRPIDQNWTIELAKGGTVQARDGKLEIDVPAGCTVWLRKQLEGPILIQYDATEIKAGGPNDRVSDLNCFWMATDARSPGGGIFDVKRTGVFEDYNQLRCYYVGQGGNTNTTTRFRRYIGSPTTRPILPEHDLTAQKYLLTPNVKQRIQLVACGDLIQYFRDGEKIFEYTDPQPYTRGWFAFRTTINHMIFENFHVYRLSPTKTQ